MLGRQKQRKGIVREKDWTHRALKYNGQESRERSRATSSSLSDAQYLSLTTILTHGQYLTIKWAWLKKFYCALLHLKQSFTTFIFMKSQLSRWDGAQFNWFSNAALLSATPPVYCAGRRQNRWQTFKMLRNVNKNTNVSAAVITGAQLSI